MKKLILFALLTTALVSCKKEEVKPTPAPTPTENEACKCGIVKSNVHNGNGNWSVLVQNNCSANTKYFSTNFPQTIGNVYCAGQTW
jgi:nitrous oxide reductase accessory protein NosL